MWVSMYIYVPTYLSINFSCSPVKMLMAQREGNIFTPGLRCWSVHCCQNQAVQDMSRIRLFQCTGNIKMKKEPRQLCGYAAAAKFCIVDQAFDAIANDSSP